jgi:hypothetical protein
LYAICIDYSFKRKEKIQSILVNGITSNESKKEDEYEIRKRERTVKYLQFFHLNLMNQTIKNNHMQNNKNIVNVHTYIKMI